METVHNETKNHNSLHFYDKSAIVWTTGKLPMTNGEIVDSALFESVVYKFTEYLREKESPLLDIFEDGLSEIKQDEALVDLLRDYASLKRVENAMTMASASEGKYLDKVREECWKEEKKKFHGIQGNIHTLEQLGEELYNFWRNYERYLVCISEGNANLDKSPYRTFDATIERMNHLVRSVYRDVLENVTLTHPRVYRQMAAGFQMGAIVKKSAWECPSEYSAVCDIPMIRQMLLEPPIITDPLMNKRTGEFEKVDSNPLEGLVFNKREWLCYPAKIGDYVIHVFFHNKFMGLGCSLANLFELATDEDLKRKPDAIYAFGVDEDALDRYGKLPTVFYDDEKSGMLVAAVPRRNEFGYFGYLKKMCLTLHNAIVMKKGRLPIHGAMVRIVLKNNKSANIVILGDTGTGKSESLEAFRILAKDYIKSMSIIFDDMGSFELTPKGEILAYGTEIGAFVRLDDLQPGFAFGNIDRSIIMSPQKINARAVLPVTTISEILKGHHVDFFLYANNYEKVDEKHPHLEELKTVEEAISIFKEGASMSKGTTTSSGLVKTYFCNIFGPVQYRDLHDKLADKYFRAIFKSGIRVGQLRTMLGIPGFETTGCELAAKALFEAISKDD
jgi:hypothetical protein